RVDSVLHIRPTDSEADGFLLAIEAQGRRADDKPLGATDGETTDYFTELLEIGLGEGPARETWRKLMKAVGTYFPGRGTIVEESYLRGISDGMAEARRQTLLRLLDKRGVPVSEAARTRIADCTDADVLDRWLDRAFTVTDAADLFTEA
ncbi:MAG TPA: hypothetical protein VFH77_09935, partial [Streptomyces sp.]|nr:hypothetical protein [Streptomyces sp.]